MGGTATGMRENGLTVQHNTVLTGLIREVLIIGEEPHPTRVIIIIAGVSKTRCPVGGYYTGGSPIEFTGAGVVSSVNTIH